MIGRRTFLSQMAATPLVFGLADLLSQDDTKPKWFDEALARMKETGRWGVILIAPVDAKDRRKLGEALRALTDSRSDDVREVMCEAVFIGMTPEVAKRCLGDVKGNRLLLDPDAKVIESDTIELGTLGNTGKFIDSFRPFLHGDDERRLEERAAAIRKKADPKVLDALKLMNAEYYEGLEEALVVLEKNADSIVPVLVQARLSTSRAEWRAWIRSLINTTIGKIDANKPGPRLPYGMSRPRFSDCCGVLTELGEKENEGWILACGMANVPEQGREFLRFLTE